MNGLPVIAEWRNAIRDSDLDATAKLVALVLSTYMNSAGECYPARATLAKNCRCAVRTVERAVTRIESAGLLDVSRTAGRGHSNRYRASVKGVTGDAFSGKKRRHQRPEKATPDAVKGDTGDARKREKASESGRARLDGGAPPILRPVDPCMGCGEHRPLSDVDGRYICDACALGESGVAEPLGKTC